MTSPDTGPDPATNGSASLSRHRSRRFGRPSPYRAEQNHLRGGHVAVVHRAAALTGPSANAQPKPWPDFAAAADLVQRLNESGLVLGDRNAVLTLNSKGAFDDQKIE